MAFDYNSIKGKQESGAQWSSYSDLFMMLSLVFLLLYVTASMRGGTYSIQKNLEHQRVSQEVDDLRQQLQVYNTLKEDYLNRGATQQEKELYGSLMDKLSLLKDSAKTEKEDLRRQAKENEKKEDALNKYQQMIRNIINSNLLAQHRIKRRENIIQQKEDIINQKYKDIKNLERAVAERKKEVAKGEREIARIKYKLDRSINQLNFAYKKHRISKEKLQSKMKIIKERSAQSILKLKTTNKEIGLELSTATSQLVESKDQLFEAKTKIVAQDKEKTKLVEKLRNIASVHKAKIRKLHEDNEHQIERERQDLEMALNQERLSSAARAKKQNEYKQRQRKRAEELKRKIANLDIKIKESERDLKKAKKIINARKKLAERISQNFRNAGIDAHVDPNTGEVILSFGKYYFDTDKYHLKPGMKEKLNRLIPIYSRSLFEDKKIAKIIASVEIVGFASPTYAGKYVDPKSLEAKDRGAVNYNLDLSYKRGKAVFNHIFNPKLLKFRYQKKLWPLVRVTGRSFLAEAVKGRNIAASMTRRDFCRKYDCHKAQKVIIKFNLKD